MRTSKRVTVLCILGLVAAATVAPAANQENAEKTPKAPERKLSGARDASAIVKITIDPDIIVLNLETVEALLHSSDVGQKAAHEVLGVDMSQGACSIAIEWLSQDSRRVGEPPARSSSAAQTEEGHYEEEMMRQMREIYGEQYRKQLGLATNEGEKKEETETSRIGRTTGTEGRLGRGTRGRLALGATYDALYGTTGRARRGYDATGAGSPYGVPTGPEAAQDSGQSVTIQLGIHLPENVAPAAKELLKALVENLRASLNDAYAGRTRELSHVLHFAEERRRDAEEQMDRSVVGHSPEQMRVREQLDTVVDLSMLNPEMPVSEAVELLRNSVEPPLQIVVFWRDLEENAQITPSSSIQMDALYQVRVGTALEVLLTGLGAGHTELLYRIGDNVVTVGTMDTLGVPAPLVPVPQAEIDLQTLAAQRTELARKVQSLELELAGQEARRRAIEEQIQRTRNEAAQKLDEDPVTEELEKLVQINMDNLATFRKQAESGRLSTVELAKADESLTRAKIELAKRREELSKQVGGGQLEQFNSELGRMTIDRAEKQAQLEILGQQFQDVQQQLTQASVFDPQAARIRIARETLDLMARRIADLQMRIANLQPPMVTLIGAN